MVYNSEQSGRASKESLSKRQVLSDKNLVDKRDKIDFCEFVSAHLSPLSIPVRKRKSFMCKCRGRQEVVLHRAPIICINHLEIFGITAVSKLNMTQNIPPVDLI